MAFCTLTDATNACRSDASGNAEQQPLGTSPIAADATRNDMQAQQLQQQAAGQAAGQAQGQEAGQAAEQAAGQTAGQSAEQSAGQSAGQAITSQQSRPLTEQQQQLQQQQQPTDPDSAEASREAGKQQEGLQKQGTAGMGSVEGLTAEQVADKTQEHAMAAMMMGGGPPSWGGHFDNRYPFLHHICCCH